MKYDTIQELIKALQTYEEETGGQDLAGFSVWLYQQQHGTTGEADAPELLQEPGWTIDAQLVFAVGNLYGHARQYVKTALTGTPLVSMNDFGFLASLGRQQDIRKSDLIQMNYLDMSPGIEIIRRLLRHELAEEFPDPEDKRSKRLRITEKGRELLTAVVKEMNQVAKIVGGNLTMEEKASLLPPLMKLMAFHDPIWQEDRGRDLEQIIEKYRPGSS
jgi:DNA-binding MarR family transcriptional regulator